MRRLRLLGAALVLVGSLGYVVAGGLREAVVYYVTPTELRSGAADARRPVRVGGQVVPGSLRRDGGEVRFVLSDGRAQVAVRFQGTVEGLLVEGQGAVVEGRWDGDTLYARSVVVKHSEEYTPPRGPEDRPQAPAR